MFRLEELSAFVLHETFEILNTPNSQWWICLLTILVRTGQDPEYIEQIKAQHKLFLTLFTFECKREWIDKNQMYNRMLKSVWQHENTQN